MTSNHKKNHFKELHRLYEYCRDVTDKYLRSHYLNFGSYIVLNCIYDIPNTTQYQIAKTTGYSTQRINQLTKKLEEQQLIEKQAEGKQKKILRLTAKGQKIMEDTEQRLASHFQDDLRLNPEQLASAAEAIKTINRQLPKQRPAQHK